MSSRRKSSSSSSSSSKSSTTTSSPKKRRSLSRSPSPKRTKSNSERVKYYGDEVDFKELQSTIQKMRENIGKLPFAIEQVVQGHVNAAKRFPNAVRDSSGVWRNSKTGKKIPFSFAGLDANHPSDETFHGDRWAVENMMNQLNSEMTKLNQMLNTYTLYDPNFGLNK